MPLYDYKCLEGHVHTEWFPQQSDSLESTTCKTCAQVANKMIGIPSYVSGQPKKFTGQLRAKTVVDNATGRTFNV